jgi:hypothetical protein
VRASDVDFEENVGDFYTQYCGMCKHNLSLIR